MVFEVLSDIRFGVSVLPSTHCHQCCHLQCTQRSIALPIISPRACSPHPAPHPPLTHPHTLSHPPPPPPVSHSPDLPQPPTLTSTPCLFTPCPACALLPPAQVTFYTNATQWGETPTGGLGGSGNGVGARRTPSECSVLCGTILNVKCLWKNKCWGKIGSFFGLVGGLLAGGERVGVGGGRGLGGGPRRTPLQCIVRWGGVRWEPGLIPSGFFLANNYHQTDFTLSHSISFPPFPPLPTLPLP